MRIKQFILLFDKRKYYRYSPFWCHNARPRLLAADCALWHQNASRGNISAYQTIMRFVALFIFAYMLSTSAYATPSPAVIGWSNLLMPGLGATLRGMPERGLLEGGAEVGLYYGGTFGIREGAFTIDGSVLVPQTGNIYRPLLGQIMQEAGLKLHMYDTFYHYQQAAIEAENTESEKNKQQPLYRGTIGDQFAAPFKLENLTTPWTYPIVLASAGYLLYAYKTTAVPNLGFRSSTTENALYATSNLAAIPMGSSIGEEAFFRGFMQREIWSMTDSFLVAVLTQTALFTLFHPPELRPSAFLSGIYFGIEVRHFHGNIEQAAAAHFWVDLLDGLLVFMQYRRSQGIGTPLQPPVGVSTSFPF